MNDPLLRERDFDFAEYRRYAETFDLKIEWAEIDFIQWLYSKHNTRGSRG